MAICVDWGGAPSGWSHKVYVHAQKNNLLVVDFKLQTLQGVTVYIFLILEHTEIIEVGKVEQCVTIMGNRVFVRLV